MELQLTDAEWEVTDWAQYEPGERTPGDDFSGTFYPDAFYPNPDGRMFPYRIVNDQDGIFGVLVKETK